MPYLSRPDGLHSCPVAPRRRRGMRLLFFETQRQTRAPRGSRCHSTPRKEEVMKRRSIVCVSLLLVSAASVARADVEFAVPDRKAAAAKSAPTPAAAPAPEPTISQKPEMAPPVVPGKQPAPAAAAAPTATTATWWGHAAWI